MAYTMPTADDFAEKFPELADTDEDIVNAAITEAARMVDTTWTEGDYATAILYMAAHLVAGATAMADTAVGEESLSSISIGRISLGFRKDSTETATDLKSTPYGERFLAIRRRNVGGPVVI